MPTLTEAHEAAIKAAIEVTEGRWKAAGSPQSDPRAKMGDLLREILDMARAYTALHADTIALFVKPEIKSGSAEALDAQTKLGEAEPKVIKVNIGGSTTFERKVNVNDTLEAEGASEIDAAEAEKLDNE